MVLSAASSPTATRRCSSPPPPAMATSSTTRPSRRSRFPTARRIRRSKAPTPASASPSPCRRSPTRTRSSPTAPSTAAPWTAPTSPAPPACHRHHRGRRHHRHHHHPGARRRHLRDARGVHRRALRRQLDASNEPLSSPMPTASATSSTTRPSRRFRFPTARRTRRRKAPTQHQLHRHPVGDRRRGHGRHLQHRQRQRRGRRRLHRRHQPTVTIAAGDTTATITIPVLDDAIFETPEAFTVDLSARRARRPGNEPLAITDADGIGNIVDDQAAPTVSISDVSVNEGAGTITFTVTKSGATAVVGATVGYAVTPDMAGTPTDYTAGTSPLTGTLSFAAGKSTKTITLNVTNDTIFELGPNGSTSTCRARPMRQFWMGMASAPSSTTIRRRALRSHSKWMKRQCRRPERPVRIHP